jgi:hypothetical protein
MAGDGQRDGRAAVQNVPAAVPCPQRSSPAAPLQMTAQRFAHQPAQPGQHWASPAQHEQQHAHPASHHQSAHSQRLPAEPAQHSGAAASWGANNQHGLSAHRRVMHSSQPLRRVSSQGNPAPMFRHPAATQQQQQQQPQPQQQQPQQQSVSQQAATAVDDSWVRPETSRQRRRSRSQGDLPLLSLPLIPVQPMDCRSSPTALQPLQQVDADCAPQLNSFPETPPAAAAQPQERDHAPGTSPALPGPSRTAAEALLPAPQQQQHPTASPIATPSGHQEAQHHPAATLSHAAARPLDSQRYACCRKWCHARGGRHRLTAIQ